jgi:uncharacterized protein YndB with AHSA1/START domain
MNSHEPTDAAIEREIRIGASPASVYAFWTDPDRLTRWMGREAVFEGRPGGLFRVDYNGKDVMRGEIVELDPPHRLVFTFGWEAPDEDVAPGGSRVEVTFEPDGGDGDATLLRLRHTGLPSDASRTSHGEGWDYFLGRLAEVVAT